jgi:chaperone required for assembly of F1-ATPase
LKRFWDTASVEAVADGYAVLLDGKPMHLPDGSVLRVMSAPLAHAIAEEWQLAGGAKGGEMTFADTPLTRIAGTAEARIAPDPVPTIDALAAYAESDLLYYRAEAPEALIQRQARQWQPWLDWAALTFDAPLKTTSGIAFVKQDPGSLRALRQALTRYDAVTLAALGIAVPLLGSLVLGLAMAENQLDPKAAYELGALDELFQAEFWGEDSEATKRRLAIAADIAVAGRLMALVRQ